MLWPPDAKSRLLRADRDAGKDWRREKKGTTEDEMVGWHPRLDGNEFEQAPGNSEGQRSLACRSSRGRREADTTLPLNTAGTLDQPHPKKKSLQHQADK